MQTFCTIITSHFIPFVKVLGQSIEKNGKGNTLHVLIIDQKEEKIEGNCKVIPIQLLKKETLFAEIEQKYAHTNPNHFRWALKPLFISYLLKNGFKKVIFVDPDIFFIGDYSLVFEKLDNAEVLLTPHWRNADPLVNEENFSALFKDGLYNAGFVAVSINGLEAINWWAGLCHYKMEKNISRGLFDDQRYLDVMPVMFPGAQLLRHQGYNLAYWNMTTSKREMVGNKLMINRQYEPVFIHFTKETILNILNRNDQLLRPYLDDYTTALKKEGADIASLLGDEKTVKYDTLFYKTKHASRIRTRLKRFLFRLAEKL